MKIYNSKGHWNPCENVVCKHKVSKIKAQTTNLLCTQFFAVHNCLLLSTAIISIFPLWTILPIWTMSKTTLIPPKYLLNSEGTTLKLLLIRLFSLIQEWYKNFSVFMILTDPKLVGTLCNTDIVHVANNSDFFKEIKGKLGLFFVVVLSQITPINQQYIWHYRHVV